MCGRALVREPAYSELAHGRPIHYGPKCAALSGFIALAGTRSKPAKPRRKRTATNGDQMQLDLQLEQQHETA